MIINYQYKINFEFIDSFKYSKYNEGIDIRSYEHYINYGTQYIIETLNKNKHTRQAIFTVNRPEHMSCLISSQFQIINTNLYVTFNLRGQAKEYVEKDSKLFRYIISKVISHLNYDIYYVDITINVGNYHSLNDKDYQKTKMI